MTHKILIGEDDPVQSRLLDAALRKSGHVTMLADTGEGVLSALGAPSGRDIAVLILDLGLPDIDGLSVMERMAELQITIPVIVQTAKGSIETVIAAMRAGAFDFVVKPVSPERLNKAVANALKVEKVESEAKLLRPEPSGTFSFNDFMTASPAMERVIKLGQKAAASNIPILIEGESGVGKEMLARAIQGSGPRRNKPFVTVNSGAIPSNLVESILFGHEKGSFTGATEKHAGKFVEAHNGTLFLDEIGDLPLEVQVKLLRAVQEGEVDPVGARDSRKVDIRLISATHRDLLQQVKDGKFREDLYYRLNVFPIMVPPLRDRREDIPGLIKHFIAKHQASGQGSRIAGIRAEALNLLSSYDWPGNIRQLENAVLRAVVLCDGDQLTMNEFPQIRAQVEGIDSGDFAQSSETVAAVPEFTPPPMEPEFPDIGLEQPDGAVSLLDSRGNVRALSEVENEMILFALDHYQGQMSEVARRLGIGRSTLYRKLKEYGIEPERIREDGLSS